MLRATFIWYTLAVAGTLPGIAWAQPDVDSPYRIALRNVAPFVPEPGARIELPPRDADRTNVHVLVQLDVAQLERARATPEAQAPLRRLFDAPDDAPLGLRGNLQKATYEAVISDSAANQLVMGRSIAVVFGDETARLVRWIGLLPRDAKLDAALRDRRYERWALGPNGTIRLLVTFYADALDEADTVLDELAVEHTPYTGDTWQVVLPLTRLPELIAEDSVRSAAQGPEGFRALNDKARIAVDANAVQKADVTVDPPTYQGLTGEGITVALMDSGVDANHDDFWEHDATGMPTVSRVDHYTTGIPVSMHGTHLAGIIAGSGYQSTRTDNGSSGTSNGGMTAEWRGMAPHARIASFGNVNSGGNLAVQYQATVVAGADVTNDSHEQEECLVYDEIAATVDGLVRGTEVWNGVTLPRRAAVWSAGNNGVATEDCLNSGYFGLTVASKNPIVVGAINSDASSLHWQSSLGPTYDGRLKPDVVAPGCTENAPLGIKSSAMPDSEFPGSMTNGYALDCGTSQATAVVTGVVALLLEKWREELLVTVNCEVASGGECFPWPSTLKALLIQGAEDREGVLEDFWNPDTGEEAVYHEGPDYATGYGRVNAAASVAVIDAGIVGPGHRVIESQADATGTVDEYLIVVPDGAARLRVTLAWDDEPGSSLLADTEAQLKHNLDLELLSPDPDEDPFLPWIVPPLEPNVDASGEHQTDDTDPIETEDVLPAERGVDDLNNVEQVEVNGPDEGPWIVRVKGGKLPVGSSQEYSLVSDYAFSNVLAGPPLPEPRTNRCVELDWNRNPDGSGLQFDFPDGPSCGFIPFEPMCRYLLSCPPCQRFGICPEFELTLVDVPQNFDVVVRRGDGSNATPERARARPRTSRTLQWDAVAGEKYGVFFEPAASAAAVGSYRIGVELTRPRERGRNVDR